jgi:hypothetical protein
LGLLGPVTPAGVATYAVPVIPSDLIQSLREFADTVERSIKRDDDADRHALRQVVLLLDSAIAVLEERIPPDA